MNTNTNTIVLLIDYFVLTSIVIACIKFSLLHFVLFFALCQFFVAYFSASVQQNLTFMAFSIVSFQLLSQRCTQTTKPRQRHWQQTTKTKGPTFFSMTTRASLCYCMNIASFSCSISFNTFVTFCLFVFPLVFHCHFVATGADAVASFDIVEKSI